MTQPQRPYKIDFHLHSSEDPKDVVDHSAHVLLLRAAELDFDAIAITLHDHVLQRPELFALAERLGLLLIPAAELRLEGADVVVLNISEEDAAGLSSLADLRKLREERGGEVLIFAPHPFFRAGGSIGHRIHDYLDCFDAIEYCHFHTRGLNLNRAAERLSTTAGKPLLATSDAHRLDYFGDHFSRVTAEGPCTVASIFEAIRAGRIERVSPPWPALKFMRYLFYIFAVHPVQCGLHRLQH